MSEEQFDQLDERGMPESSIDRKQLVKMLGKSGWELARTSGGHDIYKNATKRDIVSLPRHNKLKAPLIKGILKQIGMSLSEMNDIEEKAPPGAKFERMVKHIKKGYKENDGKLSKKERAIAYATAWKKYNKEESVEEEKMKGEDPCWDGYEMVGKKKKNGKEVPNCVPTKESLDDIMSDIDGLCEETQYIEEAAGSPLVESMRRTLGTAYALQLKAQNFHWNIQGPDFVQYHEYIGEYYSFVYDHVDKIAEQIRVLSARSPGSFTEFLSLSEIQEQVGVPGALEMLNILAQDNRKMIDVLENANMIAEMTGRTGLANYLQDTIDQFNKRQWMLDAIQSRSITESTNTEDTTLEEITEAEKPKIDAAQLKSLRAAYEKIDKIDPSSPSYKKLTKLLDSMSTDELETIMNAKIKFMSSLARNRYVRRTKTESFTTDIEGKIKEQNEELTEASFTAAASMHAATRKQSGGKTAQPTHGFRVGDHVTTKDGKEGQVTFVQGDTVHVKGTNNYYPDRIKQYSAKDLKEGLAEEIELASLAEGLGLWKFNKRSGIWSHERNVDADTKDKWLSIFQKDEPGEYFVVSAKKPKNDPTKGKSLKTESVETEGKFARNIVEKMKEKKMDKVNKFELKGDFADRKDKDIDNDGDTDSSDEYLHARRKKIAAAIKKDK